MKCSNAFKYTDSLFLLIYIVMYTSSDQLVITSSFYNLLPLNTISSFATKLYELSGLKLKGLQVSSVRVSFIYHSEL